MRLRNRFEQSNERLLAALSRRNDSKLLRPDASVDSELYCDLDALYASEPYIRYRKLADDIYGRRNRRDRFKSFFKRSRVS